MSCQFPADTATMMEVDHESHEVFLEQMEMPANIELGGMFPSNSSVLTRLRSPIVTTYVDTENISFERFESVTISVCVCVCWTSTTLTSKTILTFQK